MSFFHYTQGDSVWDDPVGYALNHQSAQATSPIMNMAENDNAYYQQNIQPIQQDLLKTALNPNLINQNVQQAEGDVSQQFANAPGMFKSQMSDLGIVPSTAQTADFNKQSALNKGMATAQAANQTRAATAAQQSGILSGSLMQ